MKAIPPAALRRVLMTVDTVGGVWTYAMELCRALSGQDVRVLLATMGDGLNPEQRAQVAALPRVELAESEFKLEWMDDPWEDVEAAERWLLQLEEQFGPDVIHLNGYAHGACPWRAPKLVVGHSCVLSWWRAVKGVDAPPGWREYARRVREGLRQADLIVAPSAAMLGALHQHYGPLTPGRVIRNGRELEKFKPGDKEPFIISAGRLWDEAKNIAVLSEIAPQLPWPVRVAGPLGRAGTGLFQSQNMVWLGQLAEREIASQYARAALGVFPARYEPFGLAILEAALSGCALVLGDIPSLRELWQDAACFVPPSNPSALRRTILELVDDSAARFEWGARARQRALGMDARAMAQAYGLAYSSLMQAGQALEHEWEVRRPCSSWSDVYGGAGQVGDAHRETSREAQAHA